MALSFTRDTDLCRGPLSLLPPVTPQGTIKSPRTLPELQPHPPVMDDRLQSTVLIHIPPLPSSRLHAHFHRQRQLQHPTAMPVNHQDRLHFPQPRGILSPRRMPGLEQWPKPSRKPSLASPRKMKVCIHPELC